MSTEVLFTRVARYIGGCLLRSFEDGGRTVKRLVGDGAPLTFLATAVLWPMVLTTALVHAQPAAPVRTVSAVDLDRYQGDWFEIARTPNRFQRKCIADVRASYAKRADGRIDVINRCRTADGTTEARGLARVVDSSTSAKLKVRFAPPLLSFLPFVWGDYWILGLADDYSWAVVGSPDRQYLWILARTPVLDGERFASALRVARDNGFDVGRLLRTSHTGAERRELSAPLVRN